MTYADQPSPAGEDARPTVPADRAKPAATRAAAECNAAAEAAAICLSEGELCVRLTDIHGRGGMPARVRRVSERSLMVAAPPASGFGPGDRVAVQLTVPEGSPWARRLADLPAIATVTQRGRTPESVVLEMRFARPILAAEPAADCVGVTPPVWSPAA